MCASPRKIVKMPFSQQQHQETQRSKQVQIKQDLLQPRQSQSSVQRDKVKETVITLSGFLVNLYLVYRVYQGNIDNPERSLLFIAFFVLLFAALYKRHAGWLFGGMAVCYFPLIALKAGVALTTFFSLFTIIAMAAGLGLISPDWTKKQLSRCLEYLNTLFNKKRIVRRILKTAQKNAGGENLDDEALKEFLQIEAEAAKIRKFFDGSDPALERIVGKTLNLQIDELQRDHAILLLRGAHLKAVLSQTDRTLLENEIQELGKAIESAKDEVIRSQLKATLDMKRQRIEEINKLDVCKQRIDVQRLQILETMRSTLDRLSALKFADVQTLQASSDAIYAGLGNIRQELADLEEGLQEAETLQLK